MNTMLGKVQCKIICIPCAFITGINILDKQWVPCTPDVDQARYSRLINVFMHQLLDNSRTLKLLHLRINLQTKSNLIKLIG